MRCCAEDEKLVEMAEKRITGQQQDLWRVELRDREMEDFPSSCFEVSRDNQCDG